MKTINLKKEINLKFRNRIATLDDVKHIDWIELDTNVFYNEETKAYYFTFDAVDKIQQAYKDWVIDFYVPSKDERQDAVCVAWWYKELRDKLGLLYNGIRHPNGTRDYVGTESELWSSASRDASVAFYVWFTADDDGSRDWLYQYYARSLLFLQG